MHLMPVIWHFFLNRFDDYGAGGSRGVASAVGRDIVDGVRRGGRRIDNDIAHECAVEECFIGEIAVAVGGAAAAGRTMVMSPAAPIPFW
jgi:hypothetical protein